MLAALVRGLQHNVEAASGLDERLKNAVAREQEFRDEATPEVDHELAAQAVERVPPMLMNRPIAPTPLERKGHCRTHIIELGVVLVSLAEVAQTRMR